MTNFERAVRELFSFLKNEYGARLKEIKKWASVGTFLTYCNETTGIEISLQPREGGIFLDIIRLQEGEIPPVVLFYSTDMIIDRYPIQTIVSWRAPGVVIRGKLEKPSFHPPGKEIRAILVSMAEAIRKYCSDVLRGDFRVLDELDVPVKQRAAEWNKAWREGKLLEKAEAARQASEWEIERASKSREKAERTRGHSERTGQSRKKGHFPHR